MQQYPFQIWLIKWTSLMGNAFADGISYCINNQMILVVGFFAIVVFYGAFLVYAIRAKLARLKRLEADPEYAEYTRLYKKFAAMD